MDENIIFARLSGGGYRSLLGEGGVIEHSKGFIQVLAGAVKYAAAPTSEDLGNASDLRNEPDVQTEDHPVISELDIRGNLGPQGTLRDAETGIIPVEEVRPIGIHISRITSRVRQFLGNHIYPWFKTTSGLRTAGTCEVQDDPTSQPGIDPLVDVSVTTVDGDHRSGTVSSIVQAKALMTRYQESNDMACADEATNLLEGCLLKLPVGHPDRYYVLYNLAITLARRVEPQPSRPLRFRESMLSLHYTLSRSLFLLRCAIAESPDNLDIKIRYLGELGRTGTLWTSLFSSGWTPEDVIPLLDALDSPEKAYAVKVADSNIEAHPVTGIVPAVIMAGTLTSVFSVTKDDFYRQAAHLLYRDILGSVGEMLPLNPMMMMTNPSALALVTDGYIPFIAHVMARLQSLVEIPLTAVIGRRATALAFQYGTLLGQRDLLAKGIEWLEQCLMIVWTQTALGTQPASDPSQIQLKDELEELSLAFLGLVMDVDITSTPSVTQPDRIAYLIVDKWMKLLSGARASPELRDLFQPRPFHRLLAAARNSPVVVLNLWGAQCDALVIRDEGNFACIRLRKMSEKLASQAHINFRDTLRALGIRSRGDEPVETLLNVDPTVSATSSLDTDEGADSSRGTESVTVPVIQHVLAILWEEIVKPVLNHLKFTPLEDSTLDPPRLTWCPTGPTAFLPLHAAGVYGTTARGLKTYEYVASSYTPTLSTLADANVALAASDATTPPFRGLLAISQPNTPGYKKLPKTVDEVKALIAAMKGDAAQRTLWLNGAAATKAAVLEGMRGSSWIHLACHARQYPLNTLQSAFMLAGEPGEDTLTLADVAANARDGGGGELAFLSACQTAAGDFDVSVEGVHLAAGMLVAGYRSVIATTWSVFDDDAPVVAREVYTRLLRGGRVDRTGSALALHHAVRVLREQPDVGVDRFFRWAPYIHLGV
ncbi:hypothetical protein PENSPDRAFT_687431 [Peniophora sp. CONT]|nr:hypothetical protein PENSPDRAFT_687431 [Peniophora sp. CONT]